MINANSNDILPSLPSQEEMWNEIGFHKPLAGFWYRVILTIIGIFFPIYIPKIQLIN